MQLHMYADDTQLYLPIDLLCNQSREDVASVINTCTSKVKQWMMDHYLKLNGDKTELLVVSAPSLTSIIPSTFNIVGECIKSQASVRDLGVIPDNTLSMKDHVADITRRASYQVHLIHRVQPHIT